MTDERRLPAAMPLLARRTIEMARGIGCTCDESRVRFDPVEGVPVILHGPSCPKVGLRP